tara:strand:- start:3212 stop:4759 length:1548 start_codon:yes stop_codon:yes gene_type:complete
VSRSLFNLENLNEYRYWTKPVSLTGWTVVTITGDDALSWMERQLTQKVESLPSSGRAVARLDRVAHIKYYGVLWPVDSTSFKLLLPSELISNLEEDLEKFVIMEEIEINYDQNQKWSFVFGPSLSAHSINFFGEEGHLIELESVTTNADEIFSLCSIPRLGKDITLSELINETRLNELAVDYKKGCFLGQETAAKIETRRGANLYPCVLQITGQAKTGKFSFDDKVAGEIVDIFQVSENNSIAMVKLKREWRVENSNYTFRQDENDFQADVSSAPFFNDSSNQEKSKTLYHQAVKFFESAKEDIALKFLKRSIEFDPTFADAYEVIGVICARQNRHEEAIEWMDKLLEVNSKSVMAHTNKSLALMKLGRIEEAEEEKSLATVKSFSVFGEEAKVKKQLEEEKKKKEQDLVRRESMFKQVLEIDGQDLIALFGLADIHFHRQSFKESLEFVNRALDSNPKHSQSILLKGKLLEHLSQREEAIGVYRAGIRVASAQGELIPANEMQSRLNQLLNLKS